MRSTGNRGILRDSLQALHIHVLFVAPLGFNHMAQPGTYQHKGKIAIKETTHYSGAAANLSVQLLDDVVGADESPMLCNDGRLKRDSLDVGNHQSNISRRSGKIATVMAAEIALALLISLMLSCLSQLLSFGLQRSLSVSSTLPRTGVNAEIKNA